MQKYKTFGKRWLQEYQEKVIPGLYSEHKELNPDAFAKKFQIIDTNTVQFDESVMNNNEAPDYTSD